MLTLVSYWIDSSPQYYVHILCFSFLEVNICSRKKQLVQDLILPSNIHIHLSTSCTYTNTYMPRFSPSGFFRLSKCVVPTPGLTSSTPSAVCVCVCVYAQRRPHLSSFPTLVSYFHIHSVDQKVLRFNK